MRDNRCIFDSDLRKNVVLMKLRRFLAVHSQQNVSREIVDVKV